jgi:uncharacterized SAM-binding protein YcdF (DUF218 family)
MAEIQTVTRRARRGFLWLVALPVLCFVFYLLLWVAGAYLVTSDSLQKSDVIVVLSGSEDRVVEAARLYKMHLAEWVILTRVANHNRPEIEGQALGLFGERIVVTETLVDSTQDEAEAVRQKMLERGWKSAIVVTDPYHTRRSRLIFRQVFAGTGMDIRIHPVEGSWYQPNTWWMSENGWQLTVQEYLKLIRKILFDI